MKILFLTQWFDPEPTPKGLAFARALHSAGHEVEVLTGFPNYPSGKLYPGYQLKWIQKETIDGVKITRVPLCPNHDTAALRRIINYASFAISSCIYGVFGARKPDVIYVYHPPMTVGLSGAIIGLFRRVPFVYDIQDIWPDTLKATGMFNNEKALWLVGKMCVWIYRRASSIIVISPGFRRLLMERAVPAEKIAIIYNWCDETLLRVPDPNNHFRDEFAMAGRFNVVFAGNMGKAQALDAVLDAAKQVESQNKTVQFVFVGGGIEVERLKEYVKEWKIGNVLFIPQMPMKEVGKVLSAADVLLVHLKDDPLFEITIPSKTQAYLAVGKPIIMAVKGDAAELIKNSGAGYCAIPEDPGSIAEAVLKMVSLNVTELTLMARSGLEFYSQNLAFSIGVRKTLSVLECVVKK